MIMTFFMVPHVRLLGFLAMLNVVNCLMSGRWYTHRLGHEIEPCRQLG